MAVREQTTTHRVAQQYERLPYPHRDPAEELKQLQFSSLDELSAVNMYCFRGRQDFRDGFRVLIAGGGTGDSTIHLAHQLRETDAHIVHLDLSAASIDVARKRAAQRNLQDKVTWIQDSLLNLPNLNLEPFDYINCSGVLHHLENPDAGLRALKSVLKDGGAMALMVYGQYGRSGIYQIQDLMRIIQTDEADEYQRLEQTRTILESLPPSNWFRRGEEMFPAVAGMDNSEMYDLFLHSTDRAYTVPQLYALVQGAGLNLVNFSCERRILYDSKSAFRSPDVLKEVQKLRLPEQQAAAELFWGCINKHACWISTDHESRIDLFDPQIIPFFGHVGRISHIRESILRTKGNTWSMGVGLAAGIKINLRFEVIPTVEKFVELIDGHRTLGEITNLMIADPGLATSVEQIKIDTRKVIDTLMKIDLLQFRHSSVPPFLID